MAADIFVRNCKVPNTSASQAMAQLMNHREMLFVAGWTEDSNDGDAGWTGSAFPVTVSDAVLSASEPGVITSPSAPFTQSLVDNEHYVTVLATNKANRIAAKVVGRVSTTKIRIDSNSYNPDTTWVDESGVSIRVVRPNAQMVASGAWTLMNAPAPSKMQALMTCTTTRFYVNIRPAGQDGDATQTGTYYSDQYTYTSYFNVAADGPSVIIWRALNYNGSYSNFFLGYVELEEARPGDTYPNVMMARSLTGSSYWWEVYGYTIDHLGAAQTLYPAVLKPYGDTDTDFSFMAKRYNQYWLKKSPFQKVWYWGHGAGQGYRRGRVPESLVRGGNIFLSENTPVDEDGSWQHIKNGVVVPRNGLNDPILVSPR